MSDESLIQEQREMLSPEKIKGIIDKQMDARPILMDQMI
jgi:hypothetical protein